MDAIIAANTVPLAQADAAPATGTVGWATDGNAAAQIPATKFPAYHYNGVIQELLAVIVAGGLTPASANLTQLREAIMAMIRAAAPFGLRLEFGSVGTTAWTVPANVYEIRTPGIWAGGGGGGGSDSGGAGGGGGGGQRGAGVFAVNPGDVLNINIGAGGAPGAPGGANNGQPGSPSSIVNTTTGVTLIAPGGGAAGTGAAASAFGAGGGGGSGSGFGTRGYAAGGTAVGGAGGWTAFGASVVTGTSTLGNDGAGPGGGGSGGANGAAGGKGGGGFAILEY